MADADIRRLQREVAQDPANLEAMAKLIHAKTRSGENIVSHWKIRTRDGQYCSGIVHTSYNRRTFFSHEGKTWYDKTELYKYIYKAVKSKNTSLIEQLKTAEVVEYRTVEMEIAPLLSVFEQAEVEILRAEKAFLEKQLAEKEKLIAQKSKIKVD